MKATSKPTVKELVVENVRLETRVKELEQLLTLIRLEQRTDESHKPVATSEIHK